MFTRSKAAATAYRLERITKIRYYNDVRICVRRKDDKGRAHVDGDDKGRDEYAFGAPVDKQTKKLLLLFDIYFIFFCPLFGKPSDLRICKKKTTLGIFDNICRI